MTAPVTVDLDRNDLRNAVFALVLVGLGVFGFRTSFGGYRVLAIGLVATALGLAGGAMIIRYRLPALIAAAGSIAATLALGGFAVPDAAIAGFLPSPDSLAAIIDGARSGWVRLLTSQTPAGVADNVLVVPMLCGFFGGMTAFLLARRASRVPLLCLVPPIVVLGLSVLLGIETPANLWLQGGVFAAVGIAWLSVRQATRLKVVGGEARPGRVLSGAAMLCVALSLATLVGPQLPGAAQASTDRYVLRNEITPPFDPNDYPSPLAAYRRYLDETAENGSKFLDTPMLTITSDKPLPKGTPIRLAAMDYYNGIVWSVGPQPGGPTSKAAGTFQRVGTRILGGEKGEAFKLKVEVNQLNDEFSMVWVPLVGSPRSLRFLGPRAEPLQKFFRFNRSSEAGANPVVLQRGDTYEFETNLADLGTASSAPLEDPGMPAITDNFSEKFATEAGGVVARALKAIADAPGSDLQKYTALTKDVFNTGFYFNESLSNLHVPTGHSLAHLETFTGSNFVQGDQPVGDAEQYAATMALVARYANAPARVVMGFRNDKLRSGREMKFFARDMEAWVELHFKDRGWLPFYPTPDRKKTTDEVPKPRAITEQQQEEAETPVTAPPPNISSLEKTRAQKGSPEDGGGGTSIFVRIAKVLLVAAGVPATATALPIVALLFLKGRRRSRRRARGSPAERIVGGWAETLDLSRDLGHAVPPRLTRQEAAQMVGVAEVATLAARADEFVYGPAQPSEDDARRYWAVVDDRSRQSLAGMSFWQRLRVRANPTSLRSSNGETRRVAASRLIDRLPRPFPRLTGGE